MDNIKRRKCKTCNEIYLIGDKNECDKCSILYKIYRLVYDNETIYVGRTKKSLKERFGNGKSYKNIPFIKECQIVLIEITEDVSRERYWIQYYKDLGCKLYNISKGEGLDRKEYYEENKEKIKEYYEENKETLLNKQREYYEENKETLLNKQREYYEKNKEKIDNYHKEYYEENKETLLNKQREYKINNKDKWNEYQREYKKRKYRENKENGEINKKRNEYNKSYYEENKEKIKEYYKEYYNNKKIKNS